jgi:type IV pilus assembly protein PilE
MRIELRRAARAARRGPPARRPGRLNCRAHGMAGMTLIELLTVIAVVAVLSTIAFSSYRSYLVRTNRTDASTALLRIQVAEEKYFLQNNKYTSDLSLIGVLGTTTPRNTYDLGIAAGLSTDLATSYIATATAKGPQKSDDPNCLTMTVDDQGAKGSSPGATTICWR